MAKAYAVVRMSGGLPELDAATTPYYGYCLGAHAGGWGLYVISGTAAQLTAINALAHVYGIASLAALDNALSDAVRNRLNTWLADRGYPTIPAGWTGRQVVLWLYKRVNDAFDLSQFDVVDAS